MTTDQAKPVDESREADVAAIRAVLAGVYQVWDDADAFVAEYTEDASAILPGSYRDGRERIRRNMADQRRCGVGSRQLRVRERLQPGDRQRVLVAPLIGPAVHAVVSGRG